MPSQLLGNPNARGSAHLPVVLPALDAGRILLPPGVSKETRILLRFIQSNCGVDFLQIGNDFLDILVVDIFGRATDLVDDAPL